MLAKSSVAAALAYCSTDEMAALFSAANGGPPVAGTHAPLALTGATEPAFHTCGSGADAFCWSMGSELVISVRGTSDAADVSTDLDTRHVAWPGGGKVHRGFFGQFESSVDWVDERVSIANPSRVRVVGHSLGGAVATLLAVHLTLAAADREVTLHTFGCPRVGSPAFAREARVHRCARVVNAGDPVVAFPMSAGYEHMQGMMVVSFEGAAAAPSVFIASRSHDAHPLWRFVRVARKVNLARPTAEHAVEAYVARCVACMRSTSEVVVDSRRLS
jgi:pimeloyl-ACP methyl ester carboxylesterase